MATIFLFDRAIDERFVAQPFDRADAFAPCTSSDMIDPRAIIAARRFGEVRYAVASESTGNLSRLLGKFGLASDESLLVEHDRDAALRILTTLLWKDLAYGGECMPRQAAESMARQILTEHESPGCRYFSNGDVGNGQGWNPLTESTFDAGVLVTDTVGNRHFCIWFQDED